MRAFTILAFVAAPILAIALPSADITCVSEPCLGFNKVLDYCAAKYGPHLKTFQKLAHPKGISCLCGHEGIEAVSQNKDTTDTGASIILECFDCGTNTKAGKEFLEAWAEICLTDYEKGLAAAEKCWNTAEDCYQSS